LFRPFDRLGAEQTAIEAPGWVSRFLSASSKRWRDADGEEYGGRGTTFTVELLIADGSSLQEHAHQRSNAQRRGADHSRNDVVYRDNLSNLRLVERIIRAGPA